MVELCRAWHAIIALGSYLQLDDIEDGMSSSIWTTHMDGRCRAWHTIITLKLHIRLDDIERGIPILTLGNHMVRLHQALYANHTHWEEHAVGLRRALHAINSVG